MAKELVGGFALGWIARRVTALAGRGVPRARGVILLAVLVFVALLLPLITLVLTSINTESVSTAEAIKGAKAELAAEKAINDAIALVVQQKAAPDYWTSVGQPNTAIIVRDPISGVRRDMIDTSAAGNIGAGVDDIYGTDDDYWVGPRGDRSFIGSADTTAAPRNYRYDFAFSQLNAPTYVGQNWSYSPDNRPFAVSPFNGSTIWFFNQYAAVDSSFPTDDNADGVDDGYDPANANPFIDSEPTLKGPGYYPAQDGGPENSVMAGVGAGNEDTLLLDPDVEAAMYNAKVNLYESVFTDLDRGPLPTSMLKSYANVTDEAGRLNLNMFSKKVKVFMPESPDTDYDFQGYPTTDFNNNGQTDETGWKWMDNPLFPDRLATNELDFNPTTGAFTNPGGGGAVLLDFGGIDITTGQFSTTADGYAMPDLGESVQHYYEGDTDGDGIPQSVESMRASINMLTSLGLTPLQAARLLTYLNPPLDGDNASADTDPWEPGNPNSKTYPTLHADLNGVATLPYSNSGALSTDPTVQYPDRRVDACNITPALITLERDYATPGGVLDQYRWLYDFSDVDDLPLPQPRQLTNIDELLDIPGFTEAAVDQLREKATIFSYDTNVIANYISDVSANADLENAYIPGDPQYNGASVRQVPDELKDSDNLADLRFDVSRYVIGGTLADYRIKAEEMYAYVREHLPRPLFNKLTLPVVDRMGRADPADSMAPNTDARYDLENPATLVKLLPHRDDSAHPYNVGSLGHEEPNAGEPGAGYAALNPAFSLDSCLSIVMYRNGTLFEEDDYNYNPQDGAWRANFSRVNYGFFSSILRRMSGPYANLLSALFGGGGSNPDPNAGFNVNPRIPPHGAGLLDASNLVNPGQMDSAADLLDVPLYKFGNLSISMMADPPSDFRWDRSNPIGQVNANDPNESKPVNYYIGFSDTVDYTWYLQNIAPYGPDGRANSGDEPDESTVLYTVRFTYANRPVNVLTDISPNGMWDAVIPITAKQLKLMSAGTPDQGSKVTIGFFPDPAFDTVSQSYVGGKPLIDPDYIDTVNHAAVWANVPAAARPTGTLAPVFTWREIPLPEEDGSAGAVGAHAGGRPSQPGDWPGGYTPSAYTLLNNVTPWAYDEYGDPYLMARCEVVNEWKNPTAPEEQRERADDTAKVYLQYNEKAQVPFRVSILPVRVSGTEFEIKSAYGGAQTFNGTYLLYDWDIPGYGSSYDGIWSDTEPLISTQRGDPRVIRVTPRDPGGTGQPINVSLRLYDLRAFVDTIDPDGPGPLTGLPLANGNIGTWSPPLWDGTLNEVMGVNTYSLGGGTFPLSYMAAPGNPLPSDPAEQDAGYAFDGAQVESIDAGAVIRAQITAEKPSLYRDDADVPIRVSAVGGELNYTYRISVLSGQFGNPANPAQPYPGPDLGSYGGDANTWPGPFVTYPWESTGAMPRHSELSAYTFPNPPLAPNYVALSHYDKAQAGSVIDQVTLTSDQLDLVHSFNFTGFGDPWYWVEVAVWDNAAPGAPGVEPADAYAYTKVVVSNDREPAGAQGIPPEMNASVWLRALDSTTGEGARPLGFNCGVSVDGGTGGYNYYWEVDRPVYNGAAVEDMEVVGGGASGPAIGDDAVVMTSNQPNPRFEFSPDPDAYGTYFIHCYVMDHASSPPQNTPATLAHDVVMVTINEVGASLTDVEADPAVWDELAANMLSRTPMSVLSARPPGNASTVIGANSQGVGGSNRPYLGSTMILPDSPVVEPDIAAAGQTIIIRGYNFNATAANNTVRFGGDITAKAFRVRTVPAAEAAQFDPAGPQGPFDQMELFVQVPQGAQPGYLNVTTPGGASERVFFQTGYNVTFDLVGSMSVNDPTLINFELDYQGDGFIDYQQDMVVDAGTPGILEGAAEGITHDYAADGTGNYSATLIVTDLVSGRRQVSHQLVTIKDLRTTAGFLTITSGTVTGVAGAPPNVTIEDNLANFLLMGTIDATWSITNLNTGSANYGRSTTVNQVIDATNLAIGANILAVGDVYEIRKSLDNPTNNGMLNNIWPTIEMRSDTFTAQPGQGMMFNSAVGGVSSTGLKYKWALNLNDVTTTAEPTPEDRVDFRVNPGGGSVYNGGGFPPLYVITTNTNWSYVNLPTLPFNVFNDSDGGAVWRVRYLPGNTLPGFDYNGGAFQPGDDVIQPNQLGVEYVSGGMGPFEWAPGDLGHLGTGSANSGRNRVTTGLVYDIFGGANNPDYGRLDNILIDADNDFRQSGPRGVSVGDVAFNETDGSTGTIYSIDSSIQLRMDNGADPSHVIGLLNGGPIGRAGALTGRSPDLAPGAPFQAIFDITQNNYIWHGRGAGTGEGGFIVGDGNPAMFVDENGNAMPYAGDSFFHNLTDFTAWEVIGVNVPPTPNDDTMRVQFMNTIPNPLGIVVGPTDGLRIFDVTAVSVLGGAPPVAVLTTTIDWTTLNLPALPFDIHNNDDNNATWRVTALPGEDVPAFGVLGATQIRVEYVNGGGLPYNWQVGETGYIILNAQWAENDSWAAQFPRNQWRVNYNYSIASHAGGVISEEPQGDVWADCAFADLEAPVDFYVNIGAAYGLATPAEVEFDWDGPDGTGLYAAMESVMSQAIANGTAGAQYQVKATHMFLAAEIPMIVDHGVPTRAAYRMLTQATGQSTPYVSAWAPLPIIIVGGDHYDTSLRTLNLDWNQHDDVVHPWKNDRWNHVTLETCYSVSYNMLETAAPGLNNTMRRWYFADDQLLVPPGMENYGDTLTTWASYSKPFVYSNGVGATYMRHQAVHGLGSALNWLSDANADARWRNGLNQFESPLTNNPVNYHEFVFQNGANTMNVPGGATIKGASFPRALRGIGRADVSGGFVFYQATKGVYNGMGFVSDSLADPADRGFSFDSQAFFWGDRINSQSNAARSLLADFYVNPLIGSNTQMVQFDSFVTASGDTDNFSYAWTVVRRPIGGHTPYTWTNQGPNPVFDPSSAAPDAGDGIYDVYLQVSGSVYAAKRTFEIRQLPLQTFLMANPPSGTVDDTINFQVFTEGGDPSYQLQIDFGDGNTDSETASGGGEMAFTHRYAESGDYNVTLTVTDSTGTVDIATEVVNIAESVPLNVSMAVVPPAGVAPFTCAVYYTVSGGSPISTGEGNGYNVIVRLVNSTGRVERSVTRTKANTFASGTDKLNTILDGPKADPVLLNVPAPGNYYAEVHVTDDNGRFASDSDDVYASGYLVVNEYGLGTPQVVRDLENRPMHAVRVWRDPFLSRGDTSQAEDYRNTPDAQNLSGGRLMEGDLQIMGDLLTADPNYSFRSFGFYATKNPLEQPLYYSDYTLSYNSSAQAQDYYDTFTEGRININTASEDVLAALFRKCIKQRSYTFGNNTVYGQPVRRMRNPAGDVYLSDAEARTLARAVVKYRAAYYDMHKPDVTGANGDFGYEQSANAGTSDLGGTFRVDHLPVIGPWDGVNPHEYDVNTRDADLQNADDQINNAWDHMAASYYNFDSSNNAYLFYAPSDVAFVRTPVEANISISSPVTGQNFSLVVREPAGNYAKYLNDTVTNGQWSDDRGALFDAWSDTGMYNSGGGYSNWAYDARNYFAYSGGQLSVSVSFPTSGAPTITTTPVPGSMEDVVAARNRMGIIESNGQTAYGYIPNPPFRSLFDLFNVINGAQNPNTFRLTDNGSSSTMELPGAVLADTTFSSTSNYMDNAQVFSGPSMFRYVAQWDNTNCEFITLANYLDDIAPYVTCRSYTYRVEASGAVEPSGGSSTSESGGSITSRDRSVMAVIDVGPLWSRRKLDSFGGASYGNEPVNADTGPSYSVLWRKDNRQ